MIRRISETLAVALALAGASTPLEAQRATRWTDPSPHRERYVTVAPNVRLEVLDWGGNGPPLVFLTGLGNTAHVYDDFAPRFRDRFHVYAITRRGFGNSSQPADGYDAATRAHDIVTVLDSLGIDRAVIAGHSIGGDELTKVGATYPSRVRALIFLDAQDYGPERAAQMAPMTALLAGLPLQPPMTSADSASPAALAAYVRRSLGQFGGGTLPEAELRAGWTFRPDGHALAARGASRPDAAGKIVAGTEAANYNAITAPVLAVYGSLLVTREEFFPSYRTMTPAQQARTDSAYTMLIAFWKAARTRLTTGVANPTIVEIPHASHYVFLSQPDATERAMRAFLAKVFGSSSQ